MLRFGLPYQSSGVLVAGREALVPVFGGLAGGLSAIGYLNLGVRLGRLAGSVEEVVGRVAFPAFSRLQGSTVRLNRALVWAVEMNSLLLVVLLVWPIAVAPTLIPIVFSEQWRPAVPVFALTALATMAFVPGNFLRGLAFAANQGRAMLTWSLITTALVAVLFPALLVALGVAGGALAFLLYSVAQLFANVYATRSIAAFPWSRMLRIYALAAVAGTGAAIVNAIVGGLLGLLVSGLVFGIAFVTLMLSLERDQLWRAWDLIRGKISGRDGGLEASVSDRSTPAGRAGPTATS
jgi:O-antigen/teichoic acid export membrane protein